MNIIKKISILIVFILLTISFNSKVNAVSANISAGKSEINVGESTTITVNINAASWNIHVTGDGTLNEADSSSDGENTNKTFTINFTGNKEGTYKFKLSGDVSDGDTGKTTQISGSAQVIVKSKDNSNNNSSSNTSTGNATTTTTTDKPSTPVVSNDATLKNLGITPNDFKGFKRATLSYDVTVPNDVASVKIYASPNNDKATVTGTGNKELKEGKNTFEVKVTAEDGKTTKTYTLNITRQTAEETAAATTQVPEEKPEEDIIGLTDLKVKGFEISPEFDNSKYEYKLELNKDLSELDIETKTSGDNIKVDIVGNSGLQEGENVITLLVYNAEIDDTTTYQIIVNKTLVANTNTEKIDVSEYNTLAQEAQNEMKKKNLIIFGTIGFIVFAIIIFIIAKVKINKKSDIKESKIPKVNQDERIDLNKDNELFGRVNQKENNGVETSKNDIKNESIEKVDTIQDKNASDMDLESQLKKIDEESAKRLSNHINELDDFENMDNLEEFLRKMKDNK